MFILKALRRNKTLRYGVPMLLLVVGGSFGLREFTQIRYDAQKIKKKKLREKNMDEWKNIRGPRPWEDSKEYQEQQRSRQKNQTEA
ncbi:cytochrome c oxidase assembly protein COX16 homolog%2C mitochondrial [Scomber scombrus]|uniref:Cytochrome c oxidase assembly protein COX16 homolog, mitochondrial n=1 Tax=Scomber scombrus TaxID=13677 RepID=A0AAV1PWL8_SCOSC